MRWPLNRGNPRIVAMGVLVQISYLTRLLLIDHALFRDMYMYGTSQRIDIVTK